MSHVWWWCLASMKCMTWLPCLYVSLVSYYWSIQTVWSSIKQDFVFNQWQLSIIGKWPITENNYEHHVSLLWLNQTSCEHQAVMWHPDYRCRLGWEFQTFDGRIRVGLRIILVSNFRNNIRSIQFTGSSKDMNIDF